ncbi:hypothetical protein FSB84_13220 [Pseudobacter ginsenosidimutans]|nr:hypothetical protein FSB84_13220 [Pseudobacter ginsenosidimutans]
MSLTSFPYLTMLCCMIIASCQDSPESSSVHFEKGSFGHDLQFLLQHDSVIVLTSEDEQAQVIVSPKYQAKVFTSTATGANGSSFGWIHYKAFTEAPDPHMNAYGGENRFWLGPEGGPYSLYFAPGTPMTFDNWHTPAPIDSEAWSLTQQSKHAVHLQKEMQLVNYAGTSLSLRADRSITLLEADTISRLLGLIPDTSVKAVGYRTDNAITNTGTNAWNEKTGMPCIWMLDMFNPSEQAVILIPYDSNAVKAGEKIANTGYFGEIDPARIKYHKGVVCFRADGKSRGKMGIVPGKAKPLAGSYDATKKILTITFFDLDRNGKYLNQEWKTNVLPFSGDAVNAYNDGPLADGSQMGPFYEIESVSPAALLQPGEKIDHQHTVLHLTGPEQYLDAIVKKLFGLSIQEIPSFQ